MSDGNGVPCRHCLRQVPAGHQYLIVAHRPFAGLNPYTETGPIFLCADACPPTVPGDALPAILESDSYILRGYSADERIVYGTGGVVSTTWLKARAAEILTDPTVAFVHVRSSRNNCFQVRIERGSEAGD